MSIPSKIVNLIREQVASDINLAHDGNRIRIGVPLLYDDGDTCGFYLEETPTGLVLTDLGDVLMRAGYHDADLLSSSYRTRVQRTMEFFGITENEGNMTMAVSNSDVGDSIFTFAQASLELVRIATLPKERKKSQEIRFKDKLSRIILAEIPSSRLVPNWHDEASDPDHVYPVDYLVRADDTRDWYIFAVGTQNKCLRSALSCHHYRGLSRDFSGLAIYRDRSSLPATATKPLEDVADARIDSIGDTGGIRSFIHQSILASPD